MTFADYFNKDISCMEELLAATVIQRSWQQLECYENILSENQKSRFRLLLAAIKEMPKEKQQLLAQMAVNKVFSKLQD